MVIGLWDKEGITNIINGQLKPLKRRNRIYTVGK
jgi:hypothetical protein